MSEGFTVRHNVTAMFAHRQSIVNNGSLSKSLERLSSGYRINRASDDAAGLAVSETLRSQIRGTQQARKNAQDAISLLQVADAAASTAHEILQRIRELAIQAANGIYTQTDRELIQLEIDQLKEALDSNAEGAEFNRKVLNSMETGHAKANLDLKLTAGYTYDDDGVGTTNDIDGDGVQDYTDADKDDLRARMEYWADYAARNSWGRTGLSNNDPDLEIGIFFAENNAAMLATTGTTAGAVANASSITLNLSAFLGSTGLVSHPELYTQAQSAEQVIAHEVTHTLQGRFPSSSSESWIVEGQADWASVTLDPVMPSSDGIVTPAGAGAFGGGGGDPTEAAWAFRYVTEEYGATTLREFFRLWETGTNEQTAMVTALNNSDSPGSRVANFAVFEANFQAWMVDNASEFQTLGVDAPINFHGHGNTSSRFKPVPNLILNMQVGANKGQTFAVRTHLMTAGGLDMISCVNVRTQEEAERSIQTIDNALTIVTRARAELGATQNRIEHSLNYLGTINEQLQGAESRIRDTDMANEIIDFTKSQVIVQASNAMLSQANLIPQNVLSLLG